MEWHRATRIMGLCGACKAPIASGDVYAITTRSRLRRCARCAAAIEPPPPVIEADLAPPSPAPPSAFDQGRRRVSNHLRHRRTRA